MISGRLGHIERGFKWTSVKHFTTSGPNRLMSEQLRLLQVVCLSPSNPRLAAASTAERGIIA
jgi:hypothetical protein